MTKEQFECSGNRKATAPQPPIERLRRGVATLPRAREFSQRANSLDLSRTNPWLRLKSQGFGYSWLGRIRRSADERTIISERWQSRLLPPKETEIPHQTSSKSNQGTWSQIVERVYLGSSMVAPLFRAEGVNRPSLSQKCSQTFQRNSSSPGGSMCMTPPFSQSNHKHSQGFDLG